MRGHHRWVRCWLALGLLPWFGCTSRTTPLPPPVVSTISAVTEAGVVTLHGMAMEGAAVGVVNQRTLEGTIVTSPDKDCASACTFTAQLAADSGDSIWVWQFFDVEGAKEVSVPKH